MEVRGLRDEELDDWLDHCAAVFTHTPRLYFQRHWTNDPWKSLEAILVAVTESSNSDATKEKEKEIKEEGEEQTKTLEIASTVRVYQRLAFLNGELVKVGGIGEVSTRIQHRSKGLATRLLKEAEELMKREGCAFGLLHTSKSIAFYASLGWQSLSHTSIKRPLTAMLPHTSADAVPANTYNIKRYMPKELSTKQPDIASAIWQMYEDYNCHNFNGSFSRQRNSVYWDQWVTGEWDEIAVMQAKPQDELADPSTGEVLAYVAFQWLREVNTSPLSKAEGENEGEEWRRIVTIQEFGCKQSDNETESKRFGQYFRTLLAYLHESSHETLSASEEHWVEYDAAIKRNYTSTQEDTTTTKQDDTRKEVREDLGWMVKLVDPLYADVPLSALFNDKFQFWVADKF